jgi:uncharacterized protein YjbJ (UPF0337 family)
MGIRAMPLAGSRTPTSRTNSLMASLTALVIMICFLLISLPAMAMVSDHAPFPIAFGTMSNKVDAAAKNVEGKLESAYGDITGDTGHQIKGKAKQVQASAMNAAEDVKHGAQSAARKADHAADNLADDLS